MPLVLRYIVFAAVLGLVACARDYLQPFPPFKDQALLEQRFSVPELHLDVEAWFDGIASRHPDLASRLPAQELEKAKAQALKKITKPMTRREFFSAVGDATALFRDGHSGLLYPYPEYDAHLAAGGKRFPLQVRMQGDDLIVAGDSTASQPPGGSRLLRINNVSVEALLAQMANYARGESERLRRQILVENFDAWLWHVFGWEDKFTVTYLHQDREQHLVLGGLAQPVVQHAQTPTDDAPRYQRLDAQTGLLDVPYFGGDEDAFENALVAAQKQALAHSPRVLVLDLRRNPGGATDAVEALLARLTPRQCALAAKVIEQRNADNQRWWESKSVLGTTVAEGSVPVVNPLPIEQRFPGELRVLVSSYTYSAAIVMITAVQDCGIGVLVGEETGGFANQTAQIHFFDLPNTRLRAFAPTRLVLRPSGEQGARPVRPDHIVPTSAAKLPIEEDSALQFAARAQLPKKALSATAPLRAVLVVSGEGRDGGKTRPGFEMDELAQTWAVLHDNAIAIDIASPLGGAVEADAYDAKQHYNARFLANPAALAALRNTRSIKALNPDDYDVAIVIGGKGAMFDLPRDPALIQLLQTVYHRGGVLAAVCHGPAVFALLRNENDQPLMQGRRVNGFTDEEEAVFGKQWRPQFPFQIETRLREQGAIWVEAPLMMPMVVVDGQLISAQNPYSTLAFAEAIVTALGRTPIAREVLPDERTMLLAQRVFKDGDGAVLWAERELRERPAAYHHALLGLVGYYQAEVATDAAARQQALQLMLLAAPSLNEPQLALRIAETLAKQGQRQDAGKWIDKVLQAAPDLPAALALRRSLMQEPVLDANAKSPQRNR